MTHITQKAIFSLLPFVMLLCTLARGQDIPAVTSTAPLQGFQFPTIGGNLSYGLSGSERFRSGEYGTGDNIWSTTVSGNVGYLSVSEARPFTLQYSGGYIYSSNGSEASFFQNLHMSQSFITETWSVSVNDALSYLPDAASSGVSGVPGVGDVGVIPPPGGTDTSQDILSDSSARVTNSTNGSIQKQLTGSTSVSVTGLFSILRFTGAGGGIDSDDFSGQAGLNHRIDARTNVNGSYSYTRFLYVGQNSSFVTQQLSAGFTRQVTRQFDFRVSGGPQMVTSGFPGQSASSINFSGQAGATYNTQNYNYSLNVFRGVRGGAGIVQGTLSTNAGVTAGRALGEYMHLAASGSYTNNSSIQVLTSTPYVIQTFVANLQVSRSITTHFSAFVSYGIDDQSSTNLTATAHAFSGISQIAAFGLTYSPAPIRLGH